MAATGAKAKKSAKQPPELWHARNQNVTLKRGITPGGGDMMLPSSHGTARECGLPRSRMLRHRPRATLERLTFRAESRMVYRRRPGRRQRCSMTIEQTPTIRNDATRCPVHRTNCQASAVLPRRSRMAIYVITVVGVAPCRCFSPGGTRRHRLPGFPRAARPRAGPSRSRSDNPCLAERKGCARP